MLYAYSNMHSTLDMVDTPVSDARSRHIGAVEHVLFHPREPRVVGFQVRLKPLGYVINRKPRFVPLDQVRIAEEGLEFTSAKPIVGKAAEKAMGFSWDDTVVWRMMPVQSERGESLGFVREVWFSAEDGSVGKLAITRGVTSDIAVGRQELDGATVVGFDPTRAAVVVRNEALAVELSGGVAAKSGKAAAVVKVAAEKAAKRAAKAAAEVAGKAAKSDLAAKAVKRSASSWQAFRDGFSEGMREDEKD